MPCATTSRSAALARRCTTRCPRISRLPTRRSATDAARCSKPRPWLSRFSACRCIQSYLRTTLTTSPSTCARSSQRMEREQYAVMARREERHWWYAGMRRVALATLSRALAGRRDLLILDAGCGTGGTTTRLAQFGNVVGIDLAWEALRPARTHDLRLARAS